MQLSARHAMQLSVGRHVVHLRENGIYTHICCTLPYVLVAYVCYVVFCCYVVLCVSTYILNTCSPCPPKVDYLPGPKVQYPSDPKVEYLPFPKVDYLPAPIVDYLPVTSVDFLPVHIPILQHKKTCVLV